MNRKARRIAAAVLSALLLACTLVPAALASTGEQAGAPQADEQTTDSREERPQGQMPARDDGGSQGQMNGAHRRRGRHGAHEKVEEPENAIGKDAAKQIALEDAGLDAESAEKLRSRVSEQDGEIIYKVSFRYDGMKHSYRINALTGEILSSEVAEASESAHHGGHRARHGESGGTDDSGGVTGEAQVPAV